ncbi:MAG: hypothetical protein HKP45_09100, partial [Winogradskyella sp.]|nr:hypothetical protein [Winogradskyella sp.]
KSPKLYGAFPTDPYSHTPGGKGAQQPGMTGQVKEDILSRFGELGVFVKNGTLYFNPCLLRKSEFITDGNSFNYVKLSNEESTLALEENSLAFTYCQVPIVYTMGSENNLKVVFNSNDQKPFKGSALDEETSKSIFKRLDEVSHIHVEVAKDYLK